MAQNNATKQTPAAIGADINAEALLSSVAEGDKEAFAALFNYFAPRIKSFLLKGGLSEEEAEDMAQETMLTIWKKAPGFNPERAGASTWIFTIARNKKIDFFRKQKGGRMMEASEIPLESEEAGPGQKAIHAQESEKIAEAFENLPSEQKDLVEKSFFEGKSHADIAEETGIPLGTVKSRIRLALEKLRGASELEGLR